MFRKLSAIVIPTIIAIAIIAFMLYRVWGDLMTAIGNSVPVYLVIGTAVCLSAWGLRGERYRSILKSLGYRIGITFSTACIFVSQTVNLVVPARLGDFVRVFILKHEHGTSYSEGISSLVVERIFDIFTVALLGAVSILFVLNAPPWFYTIIVLPLVAGICFFVFLLLIGKFRSKNRYIAIILNMLHEIRRASLSPRAVVILGCSSGVIWILDVLVCLAIVMMFRQQIPFTVIILAIVIGNLVKAVPITPGGMGTYEFALATTFDLAGVPLPVATLIAVIDHLIKNLGTLVGGIVSIYYLGDWVMPTIRAALDSKFGRGDPPVS